MGKTIWIHAPEAVDVKYQLASVERRMLAAAIDGFVLAGTYVLLLAGAKLVTSAVLIPATTILIVSHTLIVLGLSGYHILFEMLWSGQTPGKRFCGIRVLEVSGRPITFPKAVIRNLVRTVDLTLGVLTMAMSPHCRRLGDYAAGTMVVADSDPPYARGHH